MSNSVANRAKIFRDDVNDTYFARILNFVKKNINKKGIFNLIFNYVDLKDDWYKFLEDINLNWDDISKHQDLNLNLIGVFIDYLNWDLVSKHYNLNIEWVKNFYDYLNFDIISTNPNFTINWVKDIRGVNWSWWEFHNNPNFTFEWVEKYPEKEWDWNKLHKHPDFKFEWIEKIPCKNWCRRELHEHPDFKFELIEKLSGPYFTDDFYDWNLILENQYAKADWMDKYKYDYYDEWSWHKLHEHPEFDMKWYRKYRSRNWRKVLINYLFNELNNIVTNPPFISSYFTSSFKDKESNYIKPEYNIKNRIRNRIKELEKEKYKKDKRNKLTRFNFHKYCN